MLTLHSRVYVSKQHVYEQMALYDGGVRLQPAFYRIEITDGSSLTVFGSNEKRFATHHVISIFKPRKNASFLDYKMVFSQNSRANWVSTQRITEYLSTIRPEQVLPDTLRCMSQCHLDELAFNLEREYPNCR